MGIRRGPDIVRESLEFAIDAFFASKPYNSWVKDPSSFSYEAPVAYPTGDATGSYTGLYDWDESLTNWVTSLLGI